MIECGNWFYGEKPRVLIVDDVEVNLLFLQEIVQQLGYETQTALSVREAIEHIKEKLPQLVLLDIMMPEMDGFQFCELLKKNVVTREIPVVFVSAMDNLKDRERAAALGAVDYILKPFLFEEIKMKVETHLKIYAMRCELEQQNHRLNSMVAEQSERICTDHQRITRMIMHMSMEAESIKNKNHLVNIYKNVRLLAQALNFSEKYRNAITIKYIDFLANASVLHDTGVMCLPYSVANKRERSEEEEQLFQQHTVKGAEFLAEIKTNESGNMEFLYSEVALNHHENYDGSGYPNGLKGEEIPLSARIFRIIDYYDEIFYARSKDKNFTKEEMLHVMENQKGKLFEPAILDVFIRINKRIQHEAMR